MPATHEYQELSDVLARAHRELQIGLNSLLRDEDLTVEQWRILKSLSDSDGKSMSDLANEVFMNLPALSKNIDKLVVRALVFRQQDIDDQRRVLVYISDFGTELLGSAQERMEQYHANLAIRLGKNGTKSLVRLLDKITS